MNSYIKGAWNPLGTLYSDFSATPFVTWRIANTDLGGYFASDSSPAGWDVTSTQVFVPLAAVTTGASYYIEFYTSTHGYVYQGNLVDGFTRYHCVDGLCESYQAATDTEGFASCEDAGCLAGVTRYFCANCAEGIADSDPDGGGYASEADCIAACGTPPDGGWWLCNGGTSTCAQDPDALEGYATEEECLSFCASGSGCPVITSFDTTFFSPTVAHIVFYVSGAPADYTYSYVKTSGDGTVSPGGFFGINTCRIDFLPGQTITVLATVSKEGCADATQSVTVVNPGVFDPCAAEPPLALSFARTTGTTFRVTASKPSSFAYATGGAIANDTSTTCLISVAAGDTATVKAHAVVGDCSFDATITVDGGATTGGDSGCTAGINLSVEDLGGAMYRFTANLTGIQSGAPVVQWIDGGMVSSDAGLPLQYTVKIDQGTSKTVAASVLDGSCPAADVLVVTNSDNEGGAVYPPVVPDDDCVAAIGNYVRDIQAEITDPSKVIYRARFGFELRDDCLNPACRKFFQAYQSSDAALMGVYTDDALKAHFALALEGGQAQTAFMDRPQRQQILAGATMRPATQHVHMRITENPVYELWPLDTVGDVVKIRDLDGKSSFLFTTFPSRVLQYTPPAAGAIGSDRAGTLTVLKDLTGLGAEDALDACISGDKVYVSRTGEVFALDTDVGQNTYNSGVRGESGTVFLETVGTKPIILYVDTETRAYNLDFPSGTPIWTIPHVVTKTQVADGKLLLAVGDDLFTSDAGTAVPTLDHSFPATITALAKDYVGLSNDHIYRKLSTGWADSVTLAGPVGAVWPWYGGADAMRALAGAASGSGAGTLKAEQVSLNWTADRALTDATGVRSMRSLSIELVAATATTPAVNDERMLIGDDNHTLWAYSQAVIPAGAVLGCHIYIPRVTPFTRTTAL